MRSNISYVILACHIDKGMKSFGSKGLLEFHHKKLFDYQIEWIHKHQQKLNIPYEIIIVSNFETTKIQKHINGISIIECSTNPIAVACLKSKFDYMVFVDYGCLFSPNILNNITDQNSDNIIYTVNDTSLDIGCIINNNLIQHIYFDLPENRFTNIFSLNKQSKQDIVSNIFYNRSNLLYFETLNALINDGRQIRNIGIEKRDFLYFKHMDQKYAINKFIKKISGKY